MSLIDTSYLVSIQTGLSRNFGIEGAPDPMDRPWSTGFFKEPINGAVWVGKMNLDGDNE
ncbi:hypothetical protein NUACC21_63620 [Scytonema sp. NUACC21]